jgi:hypothetical protein
MAVLLLGACSKAERACDPTDPLCGGGGGNPIDTIVVTSAIDSVIDVGATTQLTSVARDGNGATVSVANWGWTSLQTATATVHPTTGLVTALDVGTATIRASQTVTPGVTGDLRLRVVDADLPMVAALVGDSIATRLRQALSTTPRGAMTTIVTNCIAQGTSGNLLALNTCLTNAAAVSGGTNQHDNKLLDVLDLFYEHARRQLQL